MSELQVREGRNHKGDRIQKIYSVNCPECGNYQVHFEFICSMDSMAKTDEEKLIRIQQIEEMIKKVKGGERLEFASILFGCQQHYANVPREKVDRKEKKPYLIMRPDDISKLNNIPISHIYLAQKIAPT